MQTEQAKPQSLGWLVLGLALGLLSVLVSILIPTSTTMGNDQVVAVVNGSSITQEKFDSHLQAYSIDKKTPLEREDADYILQRIVEEELLVQRGLEVGMLESDKRSRAALVNAMISMTTASAEAKAPTDQQLTDFLEDNLGYFTATPRFRVRQMVINGEDSKQNSSLAYQRLAAGEEFHVINRELGSEVALSVPNSLLPATKLREYLGPTLTRVIVEQKSGFVSSPQPTDRGYIIMQLLENEIGAAPSMEAVRAQLEADYVRRAGDQALREYIDWLKERADISYPSGLTL